MKRIGVTGLMVCAGLLVGGDSLAEKRESITRMRQEFSKTTPWLNLSDKRSGTELLKLLDENGSFRDLSEQEADYRKTTGANPDMTTQSFKHRF